MSWYVSLCIANRLWKCIIKVINSFNDPSIETPLCIKYYFGDIAVT